MRKIYIIVFVAASQGAAAQNLSDVLEKYFQVSGGLETIKKATSFSKKHTNYGFYPKIDTSIYEGQSMLPHFSHWKTRSPNGDLIFESFSNAKGSLLCLQKPFPQRSEREHPVEQTIDPAREILKLYEGKKLKLEKLDTILKKNVWHVRTKFHGLDPDISFYFDKNDGHLIAQRKDNVKTNIILYSDFRKTNSGLITSFKIETLYNYKTIAREIVSNIDFGMQFSESEFDFNPETPKSKRNSNSPFNKIEYIDAKLGNQSFPVMLKAFRGKRILIDLWATWCGPCKKEALDYNDSLYSFLAANKIEMLFISIDNKKQEDDWKRDVEWFSMNGYHLLAEKYLIESFQTEIYGLEPLSIPRYILVNENGDILSKHLTRPSDPKFKSDLKTLLE